MSDSVNGDREQRKTAGMDESNAMTVEFLRARLLSERSVSKSARHRADELAKRVSELEEQLKFVSLQRKNAEKATANVLAILENHGISDDVSEELDSCSDHDKSPRDFNRSSTVQVSSMNMRPIKNELDAYSSSEVESLPSTGRSLSWRSTKEFQHSLEKNKYMDSVRRRASFASNSLSPRRIGKSCRRIRHRETRSTDELQNDGSENAYSVDASGSRYENRKNSPTSTTVGSNSGSQKTNERDQDMEHALRHQAQLIGRYEEEEKVQREWEEKFRENNSGTQDSGDPGTHSDVTEERCDMKSAELSRAAAAATPNSNSQETKQELINNTEPPPQSTLPSLSESADKRSWHDEKYTNACESEFSFPTTKKKVDTDFSRKQHEASEHKSQQFLPMSQTTRYGSTKTSSYQEKIVSLPTSKRISSPLDLAVVPSNNLEPVLEALHKAKSSLNQKLNNLPFPTNAEKNKVESFQIPFGTPGLFRLPTDYQFETGIEAQPTLAISFPENSFSGFQSKPFIKSRSDFSGDIFLTAHEIRPGISPNRSISQPISNEGPSSTSIRMNNPDPYTNPVRDSYPFLPDATLHLPLNEEGTLRTFMGSSLERSLPSVMRLSSYDEHVGPNMYR